MKKIILISLVIFLGTSQLFSAPVDVAKAMKAGERFAQSHFANVSKSDEMHLVMTTEAYYVFNVGNSGFVIISSDDSFKPIVGYSDEGVLMWRTLHPR